MCFFISSKKNLFDSFALSKPNQSRPANSERYCVYNKFKTWSCKKEKQSFIEKLLHLNNKINELKETDEIIAPLIPIKKIESLFREYVCSFNEIHAFRQLVYLNRLKRYIKDHSVVLDDQQNVYNLGFKFLFREKIKTNKRNWNYFYVKHLESTLKTNKRKIKKSCILIKTLEKELNSSKLYYTVLTKKKLVTNEVFVLDEFWYTIPLISNKVKRIILIITGQKNFVEMSYNISLKNNKTEIKNRMSILNLSKSKQLSQLPINSVLDCLKVKIIEKGIETIEYKCIDAWVIGSKSIWKCPWNIRAELCRIFCMNIFSREKKNLKYSYPQPCDIALQRMKKKT